MSKSSSGRRGAGSGRGRRSGGSGFRPGGMSGRGGVDAFEVVPSTVQRSWLTQGVLLFFRWLVELVAAIALVLLVVRLVDITGLPAWGVLLGLAAPWAGLILWPRTRHWALVPVMVRVVRHRLRAWMLNAGIRNRSGRLPWTLLVLPTRVGVRVWLWMVPGLSVKDFHENATEEIAAACYGRTARVERSRSVAALIRVDLVLRDPLIGVLVRSDLAEPATAGKASKKDGGPLRLLTVVPDLSGANRYGKAGHTTEHKVEDLEATGTDGTSSSSSSTRSASSSGKSSNSSTGSQSNPAGPASRFGGEDGADFV